tara:strand:+ start:419 stop:658 length:240 start_codon:yes stop_codon:yes gene_type:complete
MNKAREKMTKKIKLYKDDSIPGCEILGFDYDGMFIVDPTMDETGRFEVKPMEYYGITQKQLYELDKHNQDLYGLYFGEK